MTRSWLRLLVSYFFILLFTGCGGGGGGGGSVTDSGSESASQTEAPAAGTATVRLENVLARAVANSVTTLRLTGFDVSGSVRYGPVSRAKATVLEFENVPISVRRLQVEYLVGDRVAGIATSDVVLQVGQTVVFSDLPYTDVQAVLSSLTIEPRTVSLSVGFSQQMRAVGHYNDGSVLDLTGSATWSITGAAAQVDDRGQVNALSPGTAEVRASFGPRSATSAITVSAAPIAQLSSLRFEPVEARFPAGTTSSFLLRGLYSDGSQRDLTQQAQIRTEDPEVARTTSTVGTIVGVTPGQTRLLATFAGQQAQANVSISDAVLTRISLTPSAANLPLGTQQAFTAIGLYSDGSTREVTLSAQWASQNPAVVSVDETGKALALTQGQSRVSASIGEISGSAEIAVVAAVPTSLILEPTSTELPNGLSQPLQARALYSDNSYRVVTAQAVFQSDSPLIAEVSNLENRGVVTAHSVGTANITATFGGLAATSRIVVTGAIVTSLRLEPVEVSLAKGTTHTFLVRALLSDGSDRDVTSEANLTVSDSTVAFFTGSVGELQGRQTGSTQLSALFGGFTATADLTVTPAVLKRIDVTPRNVVMPKGTRQTFYASGLFSDDSVQDLTSSVSWSSARPEVLSVDLNGEGTAVVEGSAQVIAAQDGLSGSSEVTVSPAALTTLTLNPGTIALPTGLTQILSATATYTDGTTRAVNAESVFSSSDPNTVSVSNLEPWGRTKAEGVGNAEITVVFQGLEASSTVAALPAALVSLRLDPSSVSLPVGLEREFRLLGLYTDQSERDVTAEASFSAADDSVAGFQSRSVMMARTEGTTTVSGSFEGQSAAAEVSVTPAVVTSLRISTRGDDLQLGMKRVFVAEAGLSDGTTADASTSVSWSLQDPTIASVTASGSLKALSLGSTTLVATLDEHRAEAAIQVGPVLPSPWTTAGGNPARTGENLAEWGGPPTDFLWQRAFAPNPTNTVFSQPVVSANGVVYAAYYVYSREYRLYALNAENGTVIWYRTFPGISNLGQPTVSDGKLYIAQGNHSNDSFMWCFDGATGAPIWNSAMSVQWPRFWAPLVVDGAVFSQSGYYGGLQGWDADTGRSRFVVSLEQTDEWSPSYYGGKVYSLARNILRAHNPLTGATLVTYPALPSTSKGSNFSALADGAAFVVNGGKLFRIELDQPASAPAWTATGYNFAGVAAISDNVVYAISSGSLLATNATTGEWMWNFPGDTKLYHSPVIAGDYIYVSSTFNTYAVNRKTHLAEWTVSQGGKLSIADGKLYIMPNDAVLRAYRLLK